MRSILSMVAIVLGSAVVFFVAALFVTGLAQEKILPQLLGTDPPSAADSLGTDSLTVAAVVDAIMADSTIAGASGRSSRAGSAAGTGTGGALGGASGGTKASGAASGAASGSASEGSRTSEQTEASYLEGNAVSPQEALLAQIETEKSNLTREREELERLRDRIDTLVASIQSVQTEAVSRQAKLLAGMKAEDAGRVMSSMDDATALAILDKMNARAASGLLSKLDPRRAARFASHGVRVTGAEDIVSELSPAYGGSGDRN